MSDGNNKWVVKWLVGALWGVLILAIVSIANNVIANDKKNTTSHESIRKEIAEGDDKVRKELMEKIESVQMEQKIMRKENNESFTKVLVAIEKIKK